MKSSTSNIIKLLLSILIIVLFYFFYWKVLTLIHINTSGDTKEIMEFIRYLLVSIIIGIIYRSQIKAGKSKFKKGFLNNIIYTVACFIFLIVITIVVHEFLKYAGKPINYNFTNYFNQKFTLSFILNLIENCIFIPFLLCILFPLGFSSIFKKSFTASLLSGVCYGVLYGIMLNTSFESALFQSITPAIIVMMLTYLYKTNQNIWSVMITYASYILFGVFLINYIV